MHFDGSSSIIIFCILMFLGRCLIMDEKQNIETSYCNAVQFKVQTGSRHGTLTAAHLPPRNDVSCTRKLDMNDACQLSAMYASGPSPPAAGQQAYCLQALQGDYKAHGSAARTQWAMCLQVGCCLACSLFAVLLHQSKQCVQELRVPPIEYKRRWCMCEYICSQVMMTACS